MSKRARFDGPEPSVRVYAPGELYNPLATVERGHLLPADAPAAIRDELIGRDGWSEVNQSEAKPEAKSKEA